MAEYIDRENYCKNICLCWGFGCEKSKCPIWTAPAADAATVVHGRWEQVQRWATKAKYRCSVCGREIMSATKANIEKYPYCHCGAKMDGGEEKQMKEEANNG